MKTPKHGMSQTKRAATRPKGRPLLVDGEMPDARTVRRAARMAELRKTRAAREAAFRELLNGPYVSVGDRKFGPGQDAEYKACLAKYAERQRQKEKKAFRRQVERQIERDRAAFETRIARLSPKEQARRYGRTVDSGARTAVGDLLFYRRHYGGHEFDWCRGVQMDMEMFLCLILEDGVLVVTALWLLRDLLNRVVHRLRRPSYYKEENARRRALRVERRKIMPRRTLNPCPTREDFLVAWEFARESKEDIVRFGGMVHDLEAYVDNSLSWTLAKDGVTRKMRRMPGVKGWIAENCPELAGKYKTIMRYKSLAKKLRQAADLIDPYPTAVLLSECPDSAECRDEKSAIGLQSEKTGDVCGGDIAMGEMRTHGGLDSGSEWQNANKKLSEMMKMAKGRFTRGWRWEKTEWDDGQHLMEAVRRTKRMLDGCAETQVAVARMLEKMLDRLARQNE